MALGQASGADMSDSDSDDMPSLVDGSGDLSDDDVPHLSALNQERHNQHPTNDTKSAQSATEIE